MDLDLTNPKFWISILIGGILLAAVSAGFQKASAESEEELINTKGVLRDGLLGGIFVAMAWTLLPESMSSLTESVTNTVSNATSTVSSTVQKTGSEMDFDLQVGPAKF